MTYDPTTDTIDVMILWPPFEGLPRWRARAVARAAFDEALADSGITDQPSGSLERERMKRAWWLCEAILQGEVNA